MYKTLSAIDKWSALRLSRLSGSDILTLLVHCCLQLVLEPQYLFWGWFEAVESRNLTRNRHVSGELWDRKRLCMHEGVWTVKCRRGINSVCVCVCVCVCLSLCVCVWGQSVSQLGCCCLTMAVLSAEVLRWHVSFYFNFFMFLCLSFTFFKKRIKKAGGEKKGDRAMISLSPPLG